MSILKADLIQNRAGTRPPGVTAGDFVKAWISAGGAGTFINASLGVSSIGDIGTGRLSVAVTIPFSSTATFVPTVAADADVIVPPLAGAYAIGTGGVNLFCNTTANAAIDPSNHWAAFMGTQV